MSKSYTYEDGILYLNEPMYNGAGTQIGIYMLAVPEDALNFFKKDSEEISFFTQFSDEDIEKVVEAWENPYGSFRNSEDKNLIGLLPKLHKEDKIELEFKAKMMLRTYTKEDLINIILLNKYKEKKVGKIQ